MSARVLTLVGALCALTGCTKDGAQPGGAAPNAKAKAPATAAPARPALSRAEAALAMLPAETLAMAATADPGDLARRLGRDAVVKAIPDLYAKAATELRREAGHDLLDPANWAGIGVDAHGPAGVFLLSVPGEVVGGFFSLSDPAAFVGFLKGLDKGGSLKIRAVGDAQIIAPPERDPVLVVRGKTALVLEGRGWAWAHGWAGEIAELPIKRSLGASPDFQKAAKTMDWGRDAGGFAHVPDLVDVAFTAMSRGVDNSHLDRLIEGARARGEINVVDALTRRRREPRDADLGQRMAMGAVKGLLFGGLEPAMVGAQVEANVVRIMLKMGLGEGALPRRLLAARSGGSPLPGLVGRDFFFMLGGALHVEAAMGMVRSVALTVGEADDLERGLAEFRKFTGVDFEAGFVAPLSGELGFAVFEQDPQVKGEKRVGGTGYIGLKDQKTFAASLDQLVAAPLPMKIFEKTAEGFRINSEWWPVEVTLGEIAVLTTDPAAKGRKVGAAPVGLQSELSKLLTGEGTALVAALDVSSMVKWSTMFDFDYEPPAPRAARSGPEIDAQLRAWDAVQKEMKALRLERREAEARAFDLMLGGLGHLAAVARITEHGLEIEGGQFIRGAKTVPQVMADLARQAADIETMQRGYWERSDALYQKQREIRKALKALDEAPMAPPSAAPISAVTP